MKFEPHCTTKYAFALLLCGADWFSGRVRLSQGSILEYVNAGYASIYVADVFLDFEDGVLVREELKSNLPEAHNS